jgi:hypothetical protein
MKPRQLSKAANNLSAHAGTDKPESAGRFKNQISASIILLALRFKPLIPDLQA